MTRRRPAIALGLALLAMGPAALAQDAPVTRSLVIRDHRFEPAELRVPADRPFVLRVRNLDATAEEFESVGLRLERVIAPRAEAVFRLRGLEAGQYPFYGEFNAATARGTLIAE